MKKQSARLISVTPETGLTLSASWSDGRELRVDLSDMASRLQLFAVLEDPAEFATARVADFGWTLEWACGASLDSDRLIELGLDQAGMAENVNFRRWQDANNLALLPTGLIAGLTSRHCPSACWWQRLSAWRTRNAPFGQWLKFIANQV